MMSERGTTEMLDQLMPLHIWVRGDGRLCHIGRTISKILESADAVSVPQFDPQPEAHSTATLFDLLTVERPARITTLDALAKLAGQKLTVSLKAAPDLRITATLAAFGEAGGLLINLSLGIVVVEAVRRFGLTLKDFAPTDLTGEILYLNEANAAALAESKKLNLRLQDAKMAAEEQAYTDTLTALRNRRALDDLLERLTTGPRASEFGLMHIDLDHFKAVNDTRGHAAGDSVLQHVARVLLAEIRRDDFVARVGGDEFVMVFRACDDIDVLHRIAKRIIERLEEPIYVDGIACQISASIGTTLSRYYTDPTADRMLLDADRALYASKGDGRARHTIFAPAANAIDLPKGAALALPAA